MQRTSRTSLTALLVTLTAAAQDRRVADFTPDPATVEHHGAAFRHPQNGWIVLHIEGAPRERGFQHGKLLWREIEGYLTTCASMRSTKAPADGWRDWRVMADALFLRGFEPEWIEEMRGIAEGAAAGGARWQGRPLDLLDVVTLNCVVELDFLEDALPATPAANKRDRDHCSAFVATKPATKDGKAMLGHITMWSIAQASHFRVWLDVRPEKGHRVGLQTWPGGIWSGMDYYMNGAGILLCETTIEQTGFEREGKPLAARARNAIQYGESIDQVVKALGEGNNGLYTNEWLIADTRTQEIAMFELGTRKSRLWRSSRNEWFGGTEGFYWGCNNAKDLDVRMEAVADPAQSQKDLTWVPSDRDLKWLTLFEQHQGKLDPEFGFTAFTTPPLSAARSLDAKFTTADLLKEWKTWAVFGPPIGPVWQPDAAQQARNPFVRALVGNDWTLLTVAPVAQGPANVGRAEVHGDWDGFKLPEPAPPGSSWNGILLAAADADVWLAAGFAGYEPVFNVMPHHPDAQVTPVHQAEIERRLFRWRSQYGIAVRRMGKNVALAETHGDLRSGSWHALAAAKGVLVLHELQEVMGRDRFRRLMREFGQEHAGRKVTTAEFVAAAEKVHGSSLTKFFDRVLREAEQPAAPKGRVWTIRTFEEEPEQSVIVYGTRLEARANREAAETLQAMVARRWHNLAIPVRADAEVTDEELRSRHVVLVGRPATNTVSERFAAALPVRFGAASFVAEGTTHFRAGAAVITAGDHPQSPRHSIVLHAGLSAEATWHCVRLPESALGQATDLLVLPEK
jgi:hypothetical protein